MTVFDKQSSMSRHTRLCVDMIGVDTSPNATTQHKHNVIISNHQRLVFIVRRYDSAVYASGHQLRHMTRGGRGPLGVIVYDGEGGRVCLCVRTQRRSGCQTSLKSGCQQLAKNISIAVPHF